MRRPKGILWKTAAVFMVLALLSYMLEPVAFLRGPEVVLAKEMEVEGKKASRHVGVLDEEYDGRFYAYAVDYFYPEDYPEQEFTELNPDELSADELAKYDTLLFFMFNPNGLSQEQKEAIVKWVEAGGKLVIWDSDAVEPNAPWDYSWLPYPFTSSVPGQQGATGLGLEITQDTVLASRDPNSPYYVDTKELNDFTDAVGDANVMLIPEDAPGWIHVMYATNILGQRGPVLSYAPYGNGVIVYSGLDWDYAGWAVTSGKWLVQLMHNMFALDAKYVDEKKIPYGRSLSAQKAIGYDSIVQHEIRPYPRQESQESYVQDPIFTATGSHVLQRTLLFQRGAIDLPFIVHYDSQLLGKGPMGHGWGHNFETHLEILDGGDVILRWDANRWNEFIRFGKDQYAAQDLHMRFDRLTRDASGNFTLERVTGEVFRFDVKGRLVERIFGDKKIVMSYDAEGQLQRVEEPVSRRGYTFTYDPQTKLLTKVRDDAGREVRFAYDANYNLVEIEDAEGHVVRYTYDGAGRVLKGVDEQGNVLFQNEYDAMGRVVSQWDGDPSHPPGRFQYEELEEGFTRTTYTDRTGAKKVYVHDGYYRLVKVQDELGGVTSFTYDANGNLVEIVDPANRVTKLAYDERGRMIRMIDPMGGETRYAYDDRGRLIEVVEGDLKRLTIAYDEAGNPTEISGPDGRGVRIAYTAEGLPETLQLPGGGVYRLAYDRGLPSKVVDPEGVAVEFEYDSAGRMTEIRDAEGNTTRLTYDRNDNLLEITDPLGSRWGFAYDAWGNLIRVTDANGNVTRLNLGPTGRVEEIVDALGNTTRIEYDAEDRPVRLIDPLGNTTVLQRDAMGRVEALQDATGGVWQLFYDASGRVNALVDPTKKTLFHAEYDALDRLLKIADGLGNAQTFAYDALGRMVKSVDPLGRTTSYAYDVYDRIVEALDALGGKSSQTFDVDGNLESLTDPNGNTTRFVYDRAGRPVEIVTAAGDRTRIEYDARGLVSKVVNGRGQEILYRYDEAGRLTKVIYPDREVSYRYDANGNLLEVEDPIGKIVREYDALNRVVRFTDARGNTIRYTYDAGGNLVKLTYPDGKEVEYAYDGVRRLTEVTDWAGRKTGYVYDAAGRVTKIRRPNGTELALEYDDTGRVVRQVDRNDRGEEIARYEFVYDAAGNIVREESGANVVPYPNSDEEYAYGPDNRLVRYRGEEVKYDGDGNMVRGPLGEETVDFVYDSEGRLLRAGQTEYVYDAEGNRIAVIDQGVRQTKYVVDPEWDLSRVLVREDADGEKTYYVYGLGLIGEESGGEFRAYHYDLRGSTVALSGPQGEVLDRFWYGPYGELLRHAGNSRTPFLYNGRDGVMTDPNGLYYMRARYYSPEIKRFVSKDRGTSDIFDPLSLNLYIFTADNPIIFIDPLGQDWVTVVAGIVGLLAGGTALVAGAAGLPIVATGATLVGAGVSFFSLVYTAKQYYGKQKDTVYWLTQISNVLGVIPVAGVLPKSGVLGRVASGIENLTTVTPEGRVVPMLYSTKSLQLQQAMTTYDIFQTLGQTLKSSTRFK